MCFKHWALGSDIHAFLLFTVWVSWQEEWTHTEDTGVVELSVQVWQSSISCARVDEVIIINDFWIDHISLIDLLLLIVSFWNAVLLLFNFYIYIFWYTFLTLHVVKPFDINFYSCLFILVNWYFILATHNLMDVIDILCIQFSWLPNTVILTGTVFQVLISLHYLWCTLFIFPLRCQYIVTC
jgi:hypothetical protein